MFEVPRFSLSGYQPPGASIGDAIARVPDQLQKGWENKQQRQIADARRSSLADLGRTASGGPDYAEASRRLAQAGDMEGARSFATLAMADNDRAFRREEAARSQANADRSFSLQQQQAMRAGVPTGYEPAPTGGVQPTRGGPQDPVATMDRRRQELTAAGVDPKSPEGVRYLMTGKMDQAGNAPSGYRWNQQGNALEAIPGGPGEKIDGEIAARLGLTKSFLGQLPSIKQGVEAGDATGLWDGTMGALGFGRPAELQRQVQSGVDALIRNLTGAGMTQSEAEKYAGRYAIGWGDAQQTVLSKLGQLERELRSTAEVLGRGRGGSGFITDTPAVFPNVGQVQPGGQSVRTSTPGMGGTGLTAAQKNGTGTGSGGAPAAGGQGGGALSAGAVVNGFVYRGGNPNDPNSWGRAQ